MKHYTYKGKTFTNDIPDPLDGVSPLHLKDGSVNEARFKSMGGTITDDGEPTPQEKFFSNLNDYLEELEKEAREKYAVNITVDEFKQAAATMLSGDLIAWAKIKGVPDNMIESARNDILTKTADASRLGLTWNDIFPKAEG